MLLLRGWGDTPNPWSGSKGALPYVFETLEHEVCHIILDAQEHVIEVSVLLG
jgi:hypothetical protein